MRQTFVLFTICLFLFAIQIHATGPQEETETTEKVTDKKKDEKDKDAKKEEHKSLKIGNMSMRNSQQPGPLIGFGDHVIDKGQAQLYFFADYLGGKKNYSIDLIPGILYGITNELSVFVNVPAAPKLRDGRDHSSGLQDLFAQFEYAYYDHEDYLWAEQATIVASLIIPTGSATKSPSTGFGTPSVFLGTTYNYTGTEWFYTTEYGAFFTGSKYRTKIGNQYLYEFLFGRNIATWPGHLLAWMVEFDGIYSERNRIRGDLDKNSGGNVIFMTPSIWYSSEKFLLQFGVGHTIYQHLNGRQNRHGYIVAINLGWNL